MRSKVEQVTCDKLLHVVCLPFRITAPGSGSVNLDDIEKRLKGSEWNSGATPHHDEMSEWSVYRKYQSHAYFHPFVRSFLSDHNKVRWFHRQDVASIMVKLDPWAKQPSFVKLDVVRCELVLFQPEIGVLLLEVSPTKAMKLQDTQLLLDVFRRIYPPYMEQNPEQSDTSWFGGHCPLEVTLIGNDSYIVGEQGVYAGSEPNSLAQYTKALLETPGKSFNKKSRPRYPWAGHWRSLLSPFDCTGENKNKFQVQQLGDDRAPILSWMALSDPKAVDRGNWMRTCFADAPGNDPLRYAGKFMADFEKNYCYDRYWFGRGESTDSPSRILNCGYAFSYVGSSKDDFFNNDRNGAHATFRHIYVQMGMIAHFQKAALLVASQKLSELVTRKGGTVNLPTQNEVREFYDTFVEFTQSFWFDEISPQEQGRELFQMWRHHLRIQELYDEVRQELKDLVDYTELRATGDLNKIVMVFGAVSLIIASLSLSVGVFGMNNPEEMTWLTALLPAYLGISMAKVGFISAIVCLIFVPAYTLLPAKLNKTIRIRLK